jgi:hypothetical protein
MPEHIHPSEYISDSNAQKLGSFFDKLIRGQNYTTDQPFNIEVVMPDNTEKLLLETSGGANVRNIKITRLNMREGSSNIHESVVELFFQNDIWSFVGQPKAGDLIFLNMYKDAEDTQEKVQE